MACSASNCLSVFRSKKYETVKIGLTESLTFVGVQNFTCTPDVQIGNSGGVPLFMQIAVTKVGDESRYSPLGFVF